VNIEPAQRADSVNFPSRLQAIFERIANAKFKVEGSEVTIDPKPPSGQRTGAELNAQTWGRHLPATTTAF